MLRDHRSFVAVLATGLMTIGVVSFAGTAVAAVPDNDTQAGAVEITGLPFSFTQDTTEATVDAGEDVAKNYCFGSGAPAFEHAVWFKATVAPGGTTQSIAFDVTQSDYGAGIAVLQDTVNGLVALACVPGTFIAPAGGAAGTYYFVVFGDGTTPATGGNLVFTVNVAPAPPVISMTIDPVGTATREGGAWISGTVTCTGGGSSAQVLNVEGQVTQTVGRLIITSFFFTAPFAPCDGSTYAWEAYAPPANGKFAGGKAVTVSFAAGCDDVQCSGAFAEATVRLNRGRQ